MKSKKITAVILAVCLMLSMVSITALAAENESIVSVFSADDIEYTITAEKNGDQKTTTVYGSDGSWAIAITDYTANTVQVITDEYDVTLPLYNEDLYVVDIQQFDAMTRETWWMTASLRSEVEYGTNGYHWDMTCLFGTNLYTRSFWDYKDSTMRSAANSFTALISAMITMQENIYRSMPEAAANNVASIIPNLPAVTLSAIAALLGPDYSANATLFEQRWYYLINARSIWNSFPPL